MLKLKKPTSSIKLRGIQTKADLGNGYALPYVETIKALGITDDYGKSRYNPADKVTKEPFATFLVRVHGKNEEARSLLIQP